MNVFRHVATVMKTPLIFRYSISSCLWIETRWFYKPVTSANERLLHILMRMLGGTATPFERLLLDLAQSSLCQRRMAHHLVQRIHPSAEPKRSASANDAAMWGLPSAKESGDKIPSNLSFIYIFLGGVGGGVRQRIAKDRWKKGSDLNSPLDTLLAAQEQ